MRETGRWRSFALELSILVPVAAAIQIFSLRFIYPALGLSSNAPAPARTIVVVLLITWFIRRHGEGWANFGLRRCSPWWKCAALTVGLLLIWNFLLEPASDLIRNWIEMPPSDYSFFNHLHGNLWALLAWLVAAWVIGGFAEEMIFRGYLMNRMASALGAGWTGWLAATLAQAALFGTLHIYLGVGAILSSGLKAFVSGIFFAATGKNLWPLIIVHGTWDSLVITLIYLNGFPST